MLRIVVAPNSFKNSLSSPDVATCIRRGLERSGLAAEIKLLPIADGGDHTMDILVDRFVGKIENHLVAGPLGNNISAPIGFIDNGATAIVELAKASGLSLLEESQLDPMRATTFGTGQLIARALDGNATRLIIGVGGSATVDGGTGLLRALGARFVDESGAELIPDPANIASCSILDFSGLHPKLKSVDVVVLCDVENILVGDQGAAVVFGPQKGANPDQVLELDRFLESVAALAEKSLHQRIGDIKHGGAAGGAAAALSLLPNARLESGIEYLIDLMDFKSWVDWADLVITAEGRLDAQTVSGKGPMGIARLAGQLNVPVVGLAGQVQDEIGDIPHFSSIFTIGTGPKSLSEALGSTALDLERTSLQIGRLLKLRFS